MILVQSKGEWGLAIRVRPESTGCAVRVPNSSSLAKSEHGFKQGKFNAFWHRQFESTEELKFYRTLFYMGYEVWPMHWHMESPEPLLYCRIDGNAFSGHGEAVFMEHISKLKSLGWKCDLREGCEKYVHVDELEKIEGPPPDGVF